MYLKRDLHISGVTYNANPNQPITPEYDVSKFEFIGAYFEPNMDTTIIMKIETAVGWKDYETLDIKANQYDFFNIWSAPFGKIRFYSTAAGTVNFDIHFKV